MPSNDKPEKKTLKHLKPSVNLKKNIQPLIKKEQISALDRDKLITSRDLTAVTKAWKLDEIGKPFKIESNEANLPLVLRIGRGYNVFGKYALVDSLKQSVLDTDKLVADKMIDGIKYDQSEHSEITEDSIRKYSQSSSRKIGVSGKYYIFGGSIDLNFESKYTKSKNYYFSTQRYVVKKYGVYINGTIDLRKYLLPDVKNMINNSQIDAATVFSNYGHFILIDSITGGRIDYNIISSSESATSFQNFQLATKADFNASIYKLSAQTEFKNVYNSEEYHSKKSTTLNSYGGDVSLNLRDFENDPKILEKWQKTLEDSGTLIEFGNTTSRPLVPIWEMCDSSARKDYLKAEFDKLNLEQGNQWPIEQYVSDIQIVSDKDQWAARDKCPPGYQLINNDLNKGAGGRYVYLTYKLSENVNQAYTDFFMELSKKKKDSETTTLTHNSNHVNYTRIPSDLNIGAGGSYIYLWTTKATSKNPIKQIDVVYGSDSLNNPDWDSVFWRNTKDPADTNKSAGGKYIYIIYSR